MLDTEVRKFIQEDFLRRSESFLDPLLEATETPRSLAIFLGQLGYNADLLIDSTTGELTSSFSGAFDTFVEMLPELQKKIYDAVDSAQDDQIDNYSSLGSFVAERLFNDLPTHLENLWQAVGSAMVPSYSVDQAATVSVSLAKDVLSHLTYVYLRREEPMALHFSLFIGILDLEFIPALVLGQEPNTIEVRRSGYRYQISIKSLLTIAGSVAELFSTEGLDVSLAQNFIQSLARRLAMRTVRFVEGVASENIQDLSIRLDHNGIEARTSHLPSPPQLIEIPFPLDLPVEGIELMPSVVIQPADNGATDQRPTWKLSWNSFELPLPETFEFGGFQLTALINSSNSDETSGLFISSDGMGLSIRLQAGVRISVPSDLITDLNGNQLVFDLWAEILVSPSGSIPHRSISLEFRLRPFAIADTSMGLSLSPPGLGGIRFALYDPGDVYISAGSGLNIGKEFSLNLSMKRFGVMLPNLIFKPVIRQFHVSEKALKSMRRMVLEDSQINRLEELVGHHFSSEAQFISDLSLGTIFTDVQLETVLAHTTDWVADSGGQTTYSREILIDAPVTFSINESGNTSIDFDGNVTVSKLEPVELAATGFVMEANKINFNLAASKRSFSFEKGILYLPPNLPLVPNLLVQDFTIDPDGISCKVKKSFIVSISSGTIDSESDMVTTFLDGEIQIALSDLDIELARNSVRHFDIAGMVRLPLLPFVLGARLGMQQWGGGYQQTLQLESLETALFDLGPGSLSFDQIKLQGKLDQNSFNLHGNITNGVMDLGSPFVLSLETASISLNHDSKSERLEMQLGTLEIGPLGMVEDARFVYQNVQDGPIKVFIETTLSWQDLRQRLTLDTLPDQFPLPPDNATIKAYLNWEDNGAGGYKLVLRFAAELSDLGSIWSFIPEEFRPEVRNIRFAFEATYASAAAFQNASNTSAFTGEALVEMELRPLALPDIPGADLFEYDRDQWIKASLKGGIRSVNGSNEGYMELGIHGAPELGVNFPGMPQIEPPIQIELKKVDFNLKAQQGTDQLTGQLQLEGSFKLRPISPEQSKLPVPPAMMAHMEKLFKAVGLDTTFEGTAKFDLKFKGEKAAVSLGIAFEDARLQMDLFDMVAGAARGMAAPQGLDGSANAIDLDIDVDISLREIKIQLGSIKDAATADNNQFGFELGFDATIAGVQVDNFSFKLSNKEFSFGFAELKIPVALPRFPIERKDLDELRGTSGAWDYQNKWQQEARPQLVGSIGRLKDEIEALKNELADGSATESDLRVKRKALFENSARQFLIDSIFAVHQIVGDSNRELYQGLVEAYMTLMDATIHQIAFDTKLDFVLSNVRFVLPFQNPSDIRVEGGARLSGFKDDDALKPLEQLEFGLGLSAEYIYFNVEGGDPIPLPVFGQYKNEDDELEAKVGVQLNHARIGYGYSKNALVVAFAGQLKIAESLVDDLNTADDIGIGIRLPERSRLGFKLDLIPITLGEVNFLLPLLEFDVDLRKEYSPGIVNSSTCEPYWDGLQLVSPNIIRNSFKHFRFSPFFGSLLAPNYKIGYDLMLGNAQNGLTYVCDDYLVILPSSPSTIIPMLADGVPFFNNLCTNIRLAGFGVNFNLQRPFPSMSPLALFEIFGLLADPMMPIDPNGALANTIRATIQNARITLPPAVVRMFPEYGTVLSREINYTINLGTLITVTQAVAGPVGQVVKNLQQTTGDVADFLETVKNDPPQVSPAEIMALLPPELRRIELEGSFVGFDASAAFVLLTPPEAKEAFARRDNPLPDNSLRLIYDEPFTNLPNWMFENETISGWKLVPPRNRHAAWHVEDGELRQTANIDFETFVVHKKVYQDIEFTVVLRSDTKNAIGVIFGYQNEKNHYRLVFYPDRQSELVKVQNGQPTVLSQLRIRPIAIGRNHSVKTHVEGGRGLQIQVFVDSRLSLDYTDQATTRQSKPFTKGQIGLYCHANPGARFGSVQVHQFGAPQRGEFADPAWLTAYEPNFSREAVPVYNSADPQNSPLNGDLFEDFTASDLPTIDSEVSGVLVGAEVKLLEEQVFRLIGYVFTDGTFGLVSTLDIEPLKLSVAGISVELPLEVKGRLALNGRAQGAKSYAQLTASVWGTWEPLPGIIELNAGSNNKPIFLTLHSNGRFALQGSGNLQLFGGAAIINGTVDVSHTHCFVKGNFRYKPNAMIGGTHIVELRLASAGRIGPENSFELSGAGDLWILGRKISNVKGLVSDKGAAVEGQIDLTNNWNGIEIEKLTLAARGMIDLSQSGSPNFLFEGDAYLRLFGNSNSVNRLEITGRGGIKAEAGELTTFIEGNLFWQGRKWLQGRVSLNSTKGIQLEGQTHFGLILSPGRVGGVNVASLVFRINLGGTVSISPAGSFSCNLLLDWDLGINLPGNKKQTLPIASSSNQLSGNLSSPVELINLENFKLIPVEDLNFTLPVPTLKGKGNPALVVGQRNNKIAIYARAGNQHRTVYFEDLDFVTGITSGTPPTLTPGTRPTLNSGRWPGTEGFNDLGALPTLNGGEFPKLIPGTYPAPLTSSLPIPQFESGSGQAGLAGLNKFSTNPRVNIYSEYEVEWNNQTISIDLNQLTSSPISFGVNPNHRFYLQIAGKKYAFNGGNITNQ